MATRLLLLFSLVWVMGLIEPMFSAFGNEISGRDIILILGGLFLLAKSTHEIHSSLEVTIDSSSSNKVSSFLSILVQIAILDIVFSLDSVITAVGLVDHVSIMLIAAEPIGDFVDKNPTIKMLALSFLMLIGFTLMAEGFDVHVPKGYIYFAMAFSFTVEVLNIRVRGRKAVEVKPILLSKKYPMTQMSKNQLTGLKTAGYV
jgi:predicted tellurium resistance membrane protein TerC